jgi:3-deoxy-D-manno-octulosonate 8-phosphate phosphatase KdsC-like HAD superfamily phosphatase
MADLEEIPPDVVERARRVCLLVMDVDGVLTDGGMYYGEHGDELKKFNTRDGQGIALLHAAGLQTAILTREQTAIVLRRGEKLKIGEVRVGVQDKLTVLRDMLCHVGLAVVVQDATRKPRSVAHYVTRARGGEGAVRELCELILDCQEKAPFATADQAVHRDEGR